MTDRAIITCPFIVAIDSNESAPWTFQGLTANVEGETLPLAVRTDWRSLGRHPNGRGDYSILGLQDEVAIERKSVEDFQSTVLGWPSDRQKEKDLPSRRERFEQEIRNLAKLKCAAVICEGELSTVLDSMPQYGERTAGENRTTFNRTMLSWTCIKYRVPWIFMPSRRHAEWEAFRLLDMYWRKLTKKRRRQIVASYDDATVSQG